MGTNERRQIVEEIKKLDASKKASTVDDIMKVRAFEEIEINQTNGRTRAFMKIQDGCDRFCTYCIIPYARGGRVRSRDLESVINEANKLANNGYKEIVLTGIHVASYGKDVKDADTNLLTVIKAIDKIEGVERIRLSSVEPLLMTDEFIDTVAKMPKVCPHFHLSLQSGCDETLKRMNRRYTTKEYKDIVDKLRQKMPNVAITTDVIVGFPGETNDEFKATYEFLKDIELSQMHVFKYSPRKGTPAATMENQIDPQMKQIRSDKLLNLNKENFTKFASKFIGQEIDVLFESSVAENTYEGLTTNYIRVLVKSDKDIHGEILKVKLTDIKDEYVEGTLV
jgi:threonylcarbamoyladenosine tRNA methylthiotransferase MtaB